MKGMFYAKASRTYINLNLLLYADCSNEAEIVLVMAGSFQLCVSGKQDIAELKRLLGEDKS